MIPVLVNLKPDSKLLFFSLTSDLEFFLYIYGLVYIVTGGGVLFTPQQKTISFVM